MPITIRPIETTNRRDFEAFLHFPWRIYCDEKGRRKDPYWVPPLLPDQRELLDKRRNPFFEHAETQCFMAYDEKGELVGRICATVDQNHIKTHNEKAGFFGFFECIEDQGVADALLETAAKWNRERGMEIMRGPANLSSNDDWGCLIQGFLGPPPVMMPHNPPYYAELFERHGMTKAHDLLSHLVPSLLPFPDRVMRVAERSRKRNRIVVRHLDMKHFDRDVEHIMNIYNKAWAQNWGFVPMTENEFRHLAAKLKQVVRKEFIFLIEMDGQVVAMNVLLPNLNQALIHMNGEFDLAGILKFLWYRREINTVREIIMGVLPEYRNKGIQAIIHIEAMRTAQKHKMWYGDISWTLEDNDLVNNEVRAMGGVLYKKYRLFDKKLI